MEQVHGHEVMHMMVNAQQGYTRETLRQTIVAQFGEDTRFYTCAAENMDAIELIEFLEQRGKFHPVAGGFTTAADQICDH